MPVNVGPALPTGPGRPAAPSPDSRASCSSCARAGQGRPQCRSACVARPPGVDAARRARRGLGRDTVAAVAGSGDSGQQRVSWHCGSAVSPRRLGAAHPSPHPCGRSLPGRLPTDFGNRPSSWLRPRSAVWCRRCSTVTLQYCDRTEDGLGKVTPMPKTRKGHGSLTRRRQVPGAATSGFLPHTIS